MTATLAPEQNMNPPVAVAHARLAYLPDPLFQMGLSGAARFVMVGRGVHLEHAARPADRNIPLVPHLVDQLALPDRPQSFRRMASCNISLSNDRSATIRFSLAFSSSSCFSRRISVGSKPSYFFFQLKYVAWLMPALRHTSATGIPSVPCFRI